MERSRCVSYTFSDERIEVYKRLIVSADGKKLLGAVLVGDCSDYDTLLQYFLMVSIFLLILRP